MRMIDLLVSASLTLACASPIFVASHAMADDIDDMISASSPATQNAIAAMYAANDTDQRSIDANWCTDPEGYVEMSASAETVEAALLQAFEATNGSDGELDHELAAFCAAAG